MSHRQQKMPLRRSARIAALQAASKVNIERVLEHTESLSASDTPPTTSGDPGAQFFDNTQVTPSEISAVTVESLSENLPALPTPETLQTVGNDPEALANGDEEVWPLFATLVLPIMHFWYNESLLKKICWISLFYIGFISLAHIVLVVDEGLLGGEYHDISLHNNTLKAIIIHSLIIHLLSFHNLEPVHMANSAFQLSLDDSVLQFASHQNRSSIMDRERPWIWSPVPNANFTNTTNQFYSLYKFDAIPWRDFELDLLSLLNYTSGELSWLANHGSRFLLATQVIKAENGQEETNTQTWAKTTIYEDGAPCSSATSDNKKDYSARNEKLTGCLGTRNLSSNSSDMRIYPQISNLDSQINSVLERLWDEPEIQFDPEEWFYKVKTALTRNYFSFQSNVLQATVFNDTHTGDWNTDRSRLRCLKSHPGSVASAFKACEYLIPRTRQFSRAQFQNMTAQHILEQIKTVGLPVILDNIWCKSSSFCNNPEDFLLRFKTHLEDTTKVTIAFVEHMEDVLSQLALGNRRDKPTNSLHSFRIEKCQSYLDCRLDQISKTLRFLREIALPRLADELDRVELASPLVKEAKMKHENIRQGLKLLGNRKSWIYFTQSRSGWRGWVWWMTGLTPSVRQRMVFPPFETIENENKNAREWVVELHEYHVRITDGLSGSIKQAKRHGGEEAWKLKWRRLRKSDPKHSGCDAHIVSRWNVDDKGQRQDGYALYGNNCFLKYCHVPKLEKKSLWQRFMDWITINKGYVEEDEYS